MQDRDPNAAGPVSCLLACEVFRSALQYLGVDRPDSRMTIVYLPAHLHLQPERLRRRLIDDLASGAIPRSCAGCLYGKCFPDIDAVLKTRHIERIDCGHCYEILLGRSAYGALMEEHPGTFFAEKSLLEDFDDLCRKPLELDDPWMRQAYFEHYRRLVYISQPLDRNLAGQARNIAELLGLDMMVVDADYTDLRTYLEKRRLLTS